MPTTLTATSLRWVGVERTLGDEEIGQRIREAGWAMLTVLEGNQPYAVPMAYGFDGRRFFVACGPGRKRAALETSPMVCLTIVDAPDESGAGGGYVLVLGRATPLTSVFSRARAGLLILLRFSRGGVPSLDELRRMANGKVFRIEPHEVTGRAMPG